MYLILQVVMDSSFSAIQQNGAVEFYHGCRIWFLEVFLGFLGFLEVFFRFLKAKIF